MKNFLLILLISSGFFSQATFSAPETMDIYYASSRVYGTYIFADRPQPTANWNGNVEGNGRKLILMNPKNAHNFCTQMNNADNSYQIGIAGSEGSVFLADYGLTRAKSGSTWSCGDDDETYYDWDASANKWKLKDPGGVEGKCYPVFLTLYCEAYPK